MHHMNIKIIIGAQQTRFHNIYKNIKLKLLKTNDAIWFNKMCRTKHLTPKHIHIKYLFISVAGHCDGWAIAVAGSQKTYVKPEAAVTVFELLMMGGVSSETC
jgi:hypothetical protein